MRVYCPYCSGRLAQAKNRDGPNFCPVCRRLFYVPDDVPIPTWVLGVVVVLLGNWQVISR